MPDVKLDHQPKLDLDALKNADVSEDPFTHLVVPNFVREDAVEAVIEDFPKVKSHGLFLPWKAIGAGPAIREVIAEFKKPEFSELIGQKLGIDLDPRHMIPECRSRYGYGDGAVHTDLPKKLASALIYLNPTWEQEGGKLRLLREENIESYSVEIPPTDATLLAFRNSEDAYHGFKPMEGPRCAIQVQWRDSILGTTSFKIIHAFRTTKVLLGMDAKRTKNKPQGQ